MVCRLDKIHTGGRWPRADGSEFYRGREEAEEATVVDSLEKFPCHVSKVKWQLPESCDLMRGVL